MIPGGVCILSYHLVPGAFIMDLAFFLGAAMIKHQARGRARVWLTVLQIYILSELFLHWYMEAGVAWVLHSLSLSLSLSL